MSALESISTVEEQVIDGIKQAQDVALKVTRSVVDTVAPYVPEFDRPFADRLPTADELIDNAFDFVGELLKVNRGFAHQVVDVLAPLNGETKTGPKAQPKAKPASKVQAA
jgi:hypothetical protein